tara:strand:- start:50 stop:481 length:432 start_codon:yes stop_codon:yes gene_type:complete
MAYTMMTCLPCEVVTHIVDRGAELKLKDRLKKGWALIHDEMMWRDTHHYSCTYHFCDVNECGCYRRFPGFLLRRVEAGVWLAGEGETRQIEEVSQTDNHATHTRWETDNTSHAVWIDYEANEMGLLSSMIPTQDIINDIQYMN